MFSDPGCLWIRENVKDFIPGLKLKGGWVSERKSNLWCSHQIREALVLLPSSSQNMDPEQLVDGCPLDQLVKISHCCDNMLFIQKDASDLALEVSYQLKFLWI